jgi:phospholipid-binding lipoprotein MlaA
MWGRLAALGFVAAFMCGPAAYAQDQVQDPYEPLNRDLFAAHEAIDHAVLEPLAHGYRALTPRLLRTGISNFLRNLRSPVILANDVLQAEPRRAGITTARFGINTTIGVLGLFDPASSMGLERHDEDFGQTLAVWGVGPGPYFFIPLLGPTNVREGAGRLVDLAFDPLNWAAFDEAGEARLIRGGLDGVAVREAVLNEVDSVRENSVDAYVTFRSGYSLFRESAIRNGPIDVQDLPEFEAVPEAAPAPIETPPTSQIPLTQSSAEPQQNIASLTAPGELK